MPDRDDVVARIEQELGEDEQFDSEDIELCRDLLGERETDTEAEREAVQLNRIVAKRFKTLEAETSVRFDQRDVVVHGSNTSGKTSLVDAIRFNLLGLQEKERARLVNPVTEGYETLYTDGFWQVDDSEYQIHRELTDEGRGYADHDRPKVTEDPDGSPVSLTARDQQRDVSELIELWPYESRDFGRYNMFSLFFFQSDSSRAFLDWQEKEKFLDLLFGLNLTKVIDESERRRESEYAPTEQEASAATDLVEAESRMQTLESEVADLRDRHDELREKLNQRRAELSSVEEIIDGEDEIDRLQSEKGRLNRRINELRSERLDKRDELRQTRQQLSRYRESELSREIGSVATDLQELLSLPDRCPICTHEVTNEQAERLLEHGNCPLCDKSVPDDRLEVESETDAEERVIEQRERREEIDRLQDTQQRLSGEVQTLEERIENLETQREQVEEQIEETDLMEYVTRRNQLESEIDELRETATDVQVRLDARTDELEEVQTRVGELRALNEQREQKSHRQQILQSFEKYVRREIEYERQSITEELEEIMTRLLDYFEDGLFADATAVSFDDGYNFTIHRTEGEDKPSTRENGDSVEGSIQSLLFQTAVLRYLDSLDGSLPIRVFIVDSPYGKEPDSGNASDITSFLSNLPSELEGYQIILTVATTALADLNAFETQYVTEYL